MPGEVMQIADHVWLFPTDPDPQKTQPSVGIITTPKQTILIDGGNSPRHARKVRYALSEIGAPPVRFVIYTHHHWDHVFGTAVFECPVIAHDLCRDLLLERAAKTWSRAYIDEEIRKNPMAESSYAAIDRAVEDWYGFKIVVPRITFSRMMALYLDGVTLDLDYVGGHHAADSIIVHVRESGVLFAGDCYYPPPMNQRGASSTLDAAMIGQLLDQSADLYVDAHGTAPRTHDQFAALLDKP